MNKVNTASIRKALPHENEQLSALAIRSKAHWGYSEEFLRDCIDELSYTSEQILNSDNWFYVVCLQDQLQAFYQLVKIKEDVLELEALFVDPAFVGQGLGKVLFEHAVQLATRMGYSKIDIQSDPNATEFYFKMGCVQVGELESQSIPGRFLPLMSFDLRSSSNHKARV